MEENHWLKEHSPYRRHWSKKQQFSHYVCCGMSPESTTLQLRHDYPKTREDVWFPLYRCKRCGSWYIFLDGKGKRLDSLLKYQIREAQGKEEPK